MRPNLRAYTYLTIMYLCCMYMSVKGESSDLEDEAKEGGVPVN
jgi:hypothetical protein